MRIRLPSYDFRWLLLLGLSPAIATAASEERLTAHLRSRVVAAEMAAQPGKPLNLGLLFDHDVHWHSYWRNPGDSGLKTEVEVALPEGVQFHGIDWPAPERFVLGELINFGYSGRTLLPMRLSVPSNYAGESLPITIKARWLICESECIPGKAEYTLSVPVLRSGTAAIDTRWRDDFARSAARQPQPLVVDAVLQNESGSLRLTLSGAAVPADLPDWTLFPVAEELVAYGPPPQWLQRDKQWHTPLTRSDYFTALPANSDWLLVKADRAFMFTATAGTHATSMHVDDLAAQPTHHSAIVTLSEPTNQTDTTQIPHPVKEAR